MTTYSHIIFDIDGTLTDNTLGYVNSMKQALDSMNVKDYDPNNLAAHIGPPIQWTFSSYYGMNDEDMNKAVKIFREYFNESGWRENDVYDGIDDLIRELYAMNKKLYIATSKVESFAIKTIEHFGLYKYIIQLKGDELGDGKITKTKVITDLMRMQNLKPSNEIVMVGDTPYDIEGGKKNGISTIAVGYGFGKEKDLKNTGPMHYAADVPTLREILIG